MTALLHKLCIDTFRQYAFQNCIEVTDTPALSPLARAAQQFFAFGLAEFDR